MPTKPQPQNIVDLVLLTKERIQEAFDEAVTRGRLTRSDANELIQTLVQRGKKQTDEVVSEVEKFIDQSKASFSEVTGVARDRAVEAALRAKAQVEEATQQARAATGLGAKLPIEGYDSLTAAEVKKKLGGLSQPQLRSLRGYEQSNANRKSVLEAISSKLDS